MLNRLFTILKTLFYNSITFSILSAAIINVPADSSTIQGGINGAVNGDTVLVQPGTYVENINYNAKNIVVGSLTLTTGDTAYISQTIIDGNQNGSVVTFENGENSTAVLSGFTITNGSASTGSGIDCNNSSPELVNLMVSNNTGTGIRCYFSSPGIENVTVSNNSGIGIDCMTASPGLENVTSSDNSSMGILCQYNSNPILLNVKVSGNGTSGIFLLISNPTLTNVTITGNTTLGHGGGLSCYNSSPNLVNVTITGNTAADQGGGIHLQENSNPSLENVTISGNTASVGGGIYFVTNSSANFDPDNRCNIYFNYAGRGSELYAGYNVPTIDIVVDTFTVTSPTVYHSDPMVNFTFDILQAKVGMVDSDLYVSPDGNDANSGQSAAAPLRTISLALSTILADSLNPHTIYLADGLYSLSANGEHFPLNMVSYASLSGESESGVILDAEGLIGVVAFHQDQGNVIENLTVTGGHSDFNSGFGGGGIVCIDSDPSIENVSISANSGSNGGGIYCNASSPSLVNLTISGNTAINTGGLGGGINCYNNSSPSLVNVTISGNTATTRGGGISSGSSNPSLKNVVLSNNSAIQFGGGIYLEYSNPNLMNVTLSDNLADEDGGGIYSKNTSNVRLMNSVFWNDSPQEIYFVSPGSITIAYSELQGGEAGIGNTSSATINWLEGNLDSDPLFVDAISGDYHLSDSSLCIGRGVDSIQIEGVWYYAPAADIEGSPRPNPAGSNPDMGAYENPFGTPQHIPITIHVPSDYTTIQAALNAADFTDTVLVQPGTYSENIIWPETNGIKLISAGDSSNTIIDGGGNSCVIYMNPQTVAIDTTTLIQGFKITNGSTSNGGGLFLSNCDPMLNRLNIRNNSVTQYGGGIYLNSSNPLISNTIVDANSTSYWGGGIYLTSSNPSLTNVIISNNSSNHGGGMYILSSAPIFSNVKINNNSAGRGGGMYLLFINSTLSDINLHDNSASSGGGMYLEYSNITTSNMLICGNSAGNGGGICAEHSSPVITDINIIGNDGNNGGGLYIDSSSPTIANATINGNTAQSGGGMYLWRSSTPIITEVTLNDNSDNNDGSGIYVGSGNPTITNSNVVSNGTGIFNADNANINNATSNYWGDSSGPYHPSQNISGLGDSVNTFVNVTPWLTLPNTGAPPIPAQNVSVTSTGNDYISLVWDTNAIGDLAGYRVYYDTDTTGYPYANSVDVSNVTIYTLSGLTPATIYYIAITTYDIDDNESWYSDEVTGVTRVLQASNLDIADDEDLNHIVTHIPAITFGYFDSMGELQTHYQAQVSSHVDFLTADFWDSGETASADTSITYAGTELVDGDTYYLRVKVAAGSFWSDWSELQFRLNSFPSTPILVYPMNDEVSGIPVVLKVLNSSDAESDTISYSFNIYSDAGLTTKLDSATVIVEGIDTTSWQVTAILPDNSQYWWTASANDGYEESAVSGVASFLLNIANDAPAAFILLSPADSSEVDTLNPLLDWESAFDPDPLDTVRYTLYFDTPSPGVHTIFTDTNTTYQTQILLDNTTYYWKVVATDLSGATTESSGGYRSFRVNTTNDLPGDFALFNPDNGSMVTVLTPTFHWEVPIDPDDQRSRSITSYDLYLGFDSSFTAVEPISVDTNQYIPVDNLAEDQLYYWKVVAFDDDGGSTISSIWSFWTNSQNSIPSYFHVISPISGVDVDTIFPTFTWHPSIDEDLNDMVVYYLYLGESIEDIEQVYTGIVPWITDTTFTLIEITTDNTTYYWNVVATDLSGATRENEGSFQTFNVNLGNDNPSVVELISPDSVIVLTLTPEFHWTESIDPDPNDLIFYHVKWMRDGWFYDSTTVDTNYTMIPNPLIDNSQYTWEVFTFDQNAGSSTSEEATFWTDLYPEAPFPFTTVYPEDNAEGLPNQVEFVWNQTTDPDPLSYLSYRLTYAIDWVDSSTYSYALAYWDTSIVIGLEDNTEYYWTVEAIDDDQMVTASNNGEAYRFVVGTLGTEDEVKIPVEFALHQNYPNPFNPITTIQYDLPEASIVQIVIFDLLGRQVTTLINHVEEPGYKQVIWDATNKQGQPVGAGVYFYKIQAGDFHQTMKMVLLK